MLCYDEHFAIYPSELVFHADKTHDVAFILNKKHKFFSLLHLIVFMMTHLSQDTYSSSLGVVSSCVEVRARVIVKNAND